MYLRCEVSNAPTRAACYKRRRLQAVQETMGMRGFTLRVWFIASALAACGDGDGSEDVLDAGGPQDGELLDASWALPDATAHEAGRVCAVVSGLSALPLSAALGESLSVEGHSSSPVEGVSYYWSSPSGTFAEADAAVTNWTCAKQGAFTITFGVSQERCDPSSQTITVTCE
jgi:hypothetical protein